MEKRYSKHRNSSSFREEQERKKMKRDHPVNYNANDSNLIDVTSMIKKTDARLEKGNPAKSKIKFISTFIPCQPKTQPKRNKICRKLHLKFLEQLVNLMQEMVKLIR